MNRRRSQATTQKLAATDLRNFRTFLLVRQFAGKEIGSRIALARDLTGGMTQRDLADALGVGLRSVQNYEAGETIPWKHFQTMTAIFNRPLEWFLYGDEVEEPTGLPEVGEQLASASQKIADAVVTVQSGAESIAKSASLLVRLVDELRRLLDESRPPQAGEPPA